MIDIDTTMSLLFALLRELHMVAGTNRNKVVNVTTSPWLSLRIREPEYM